ncbi:MAG TPA: hypothetical protein VGF55_25660 [Gemmataceae bacterium]|jgi:hypothetical protein
MSLTCPVCRAGNDAGPACRRCRADLALCFAVEAQRDRALAAARAAAPAGQWDDARAHADTARGLRRGRDVDALRAVVELAAGDFAAAWACYRAGASA